MIPFKVVARDDVPFAVNIVAADEIARAVTAASQAELAAIGAIAANGAFYADTATGLAATTNGEFFAVPGDGTNTYAVLYRNDSGTATEIAEYQSKTAFDAALASKVDNTALLSLGDPILVSAATELDASALGATVEFGGSASYVSNLPVGVESLAVLGVVRGDYPGVVTLQAAAGSGAQVDGKDTFEMIAGEAAQFVWRAASGWVLIAHRKTPIVFRMRTNAAVTLPANTETPIPTIPDSQQMDRNLAALLHDGSYFVVPRTGPYRIEITAFLTGSGGPGLFDIGYASGATFAAPGANQFERTDAIDALRTKTFSRPFRFNKGDKIFPFATIRSPFTAGQLTYDLGNGIYTIVTITEVG